MIVRSNGLGCDCASVDEAGVCLDPGPCVGDSTSFGSQTGIVYNETPGVAYTNAMATMPAATTATTTATATSTSGSSCTETIITGVCDVFVYVGGAIAGLVLLSMFSGSGHHK